jgi:3-dehydroquinate synthase
LGEALKLSLIGGELSYKYYMENIKNKNYLNIIKLSSNIKKIIIEKDEFDNHERKALNYGHTMGHAIEIASNYIIPHGVAVLYGMIMINRLFNKGKFDDINKYMLDIIPEQLKNIKMSYDTFIECILNDKKNDGNNICFIVLEELGKTVFIYKKIEEFNSPMRLIFEEFFTSV